MGKADTADYVRGEIMRLKIALWWLNIRQGIQSWLDGDECNKTNGGYNCQHRIMSNGKRECD